VVSSEGARIGSLPALDRGNAVTGIEWLGNDRIGIDTHLNPSAGQYRIVDVATGKEIASYFGYLFSSSPDSRHIAHVGGQVHFAPAFATSDYLMTDDAVVYPRIDGEPNLRPPDSSDPLLYRDIHAFATKFVWSPDGTRIAFIEKLFDWRADSEGSYRGKEENARWALVVVPAAGGAPVRIQLETTGEEAVNVRWTDSGRVKLEGGGVTGEYTDSSHPPPAK
jgi:hypothetical protein